MDLLSWFSHNSLPIRNDLDKWPSNKVTKSLKFCRREIPIIVFGLHLHNHEKQPNLTLFYQRIWVPIIVNHGGPGFTKGG